MGKLIITDLFSYSPAKIKSFFKKNGVGPVSWLFLAQDYNCLRRIEKTLGSCFRRIDIAQLKDEASDRLRSKYNLWIDELNRLNDSDLEWWFGAISSRDPEETNLFGLLCYLEVIKQLKNNRGIIPQLIITESPALAMVIREYLRDVNYEIKVQDSWLSYLSSRLYFLYRWLKLIFLSTCQFFSAYITKKIYSSKNLKMQQPTIMISTHVFNHNFSSEDNGFKDSCFPYLYEFLFLKGYKIIVYPVLYGLGFNIIKIYKKIRKSSTNFLLTEDFLSVVDYLKAFTYPLRFSRRKIKIIPFEGIEVGYIFREIQETKFTDSALRAILIYRSFKKIKKKILPPQEVIIWYENQVIHKALIAGAKQAFPKTGIIGAQMFIHSPNFLSLIPIQSESEKGLTPDLLLTTSVYQSNIAGAMAKELPCLTAAALRYNHLFEDEVYLPRLVEREANKVILVLLPIHPDEALEILEKINLIKEDHKNVQIIIKNHPAYSVKYIIEAFGKNRWPNNFIIQEATIPQALEKASVVIGSNSSSLVEAAARGVPVIFISRQTALSNNFLSGIKTENVMVCYTQHDLDRALKKYLNLEQTARHEFRRLGREIRDMYFKPVTEENLLPFLGLAGIASGKNNNA